MSWHSRGAIRARVTGSTALEKQKEGAGNAGCFSHTHSPMYQWKKYMSVFTTG